MNRQVAFLFVFSGWILLAIMVSSKINSMLRKKEEAMSEEYAVKHEHEALHLIASGTLPCRSCGEIHDPIKEKRGDYTHASRPVTPAEYAKTVLRVVTR